MLEKSFKVSSSIDSRPAALLVQNASKFSSSIKIKLEDKVVNAKSIMGVIALGILDGQDVTIVADGADEELAIQELTDFFTE